MRSPFQPRINCVERLGVFAPQDEGVCPDLFNSRNQNAGIVVGQCDISSGLQLNFSLLKLSLVGEKESAFSVIKSPMYGMGPWIDWDIYSAPSLTNLPQASQGSRQHPRAFDALRLCLEQCFGSFTIPP